MPVNDTAPGASLSVIATQLPYIDRRALSEAWFSALHRASDAPAAAKPIERRDPGDVAGSARGKNLHRTSPRDFASHTLRNVFAGSRTDRPRGEEPAAAVATVRTARPQRAAFRARSYAPFRTSLTFGIEGERVALLLRREGATLHVVAICRPAVADLVRRSPFARRRRRDPRARRDVSDRGTRMIERGTSASFEKIASRERDVAHAYEPGFVPESSDVARPSQPIATADPLCVAAPPGAFFLGTDERGSVAFTRDGAYAIVDGDVRGPGGRPALGFALGNRSALTPLRIDPYDVALGRVSDARIESDGTLGYTRTSIDPRTGARRDERVVVGRLAVARFPAGTQPLRVDATHVVPPPGVKAQIGVPADGTFAAIVPHARDLGTVDLIAGLEKMKEAYESYDALRAAHHAHGSLEKSAMDLVK